MQYREEKITISKSHLEDIDHRLEKLRLLELGGVDQWDSYDFVLRHWNIKDAHKVAMDKLIQNINDVVAEAEVDQPAGSGCGYAISFDEDQVAKYVKQYVTRYIEIESSKN